MSFLQRLIGGSESKAMDASALSWFALYGGPSSKSGVHVNVETALKVTAVLGCCRVLSEGIAQLPLKLLLEAANGSKTVAREHPLYRVLWRRPNDWQTSFEWRETMQLHAALAHGGFSIASRDSDGKVLELLPVMPGNVRVIQNADYSVVYEVSDVSGVIATLPGAVDGIRKKARVSMLHLRGPSWNTFSGLEVIQTARDAIGLSIASEESLSRLYSNGTRPSGIISTDNKLDQPQLDRIKKAFQEAYAGLQNAFKTIVLDNGMKYTQSSLSPVDSQTHESRKHQIEEICRAFRVFPQMVGYADKTSTYASAEQFFIGHVIHSLGPWIERWEQVLARDLLSDAEQDAGYFPKFMVSGLLRGDSKSRAEYYASGIINGWLTRNEARRLEDLNPIDGLDDPLVPLNMSGVSTTGIDNGGEDTGPAGAGDNTKRRLIPLSLAKGIAAELGRPDLEKLVGRAISARNEGKLKQARDLLNEVIAQVDATEA